MRCKMSNVVYLTDVRRSSSSGSLSLPLFFNLFKMGQDDVFGFKDTSAEQQFAKKWAWAWVVQMSHYCLSNSSTCSTVQDYSAQTRPQYSYSTCCFGVGLKIYEDISRPGSLSASVTRHLFLSLGPRWSSPRDAPALRVEAGSLGQFLLQHA